VYGEEQTRSFLHVGDAARALLVVLESALAGDAGITNVGSSEETRIGDLARLVFEITGHRPRVERRPAPPGSVARRVPDVRRLAGMGFRPDVGLADGIRGCWAALVR
jgi:UDP-glucose 4-epimerase/UDP-glucuronate decarboxylase